MSAKGSERRSRVLSLALLVGLAATAPSCEEGATSADGGGEAGDSTTEGGDDAGSEGGIDEPTEGGSPDAEREGGGDGGSTVLGVDVALAASSVTFTADRICDLDGDGVGDNAIAELGEPGAANAAMHWNALAEAALRDGYGPGLFFPVLEDGGETTLVALSGDGATLGGELRAPYESMDGCGEPAYLFRGELLTGGALSLTASQYPLLVSDAVASGSAQVTGRLSVGEAGVTVDLVECVATTIASLGSVNGPTQTRGVSLLESVVAGGSALGVAGAPGLSPDVDLDGDGLERLLLDGDGRIRGCVDGDATTIEGRDCWADDRMADAFAWSRRTTYAETSFAGRFEGWLSVCDGGYARPSLFGEEWNVSGEARIALGFSHSCLRSEDGLLRCWGEAELGQLGYGNIDIIGDDEPACAGGPVDVGDDVLDVTAGFAQTCAILSERRLKCWGFLGLLEEVIGDDETPASIGAYELGAPVQQVVSGLTHHCALLSGGRVRCWGFGTFGVLGHGNTDFIPASTAAWAPDVPVGGRVSQLSAGPMHTCALLEDGAVRCWGQAVSDTEGPGKLDPGDTEDAGDDETPAERGDVELGGRAVSIAAAHTHTCALLESGSVRCWGAGLYGILGYGNTENVGDDETPASVGDVDLGGRAVHIAAAGLQSCAILEGGAVRCWGLGGGGALGYGDTENVGDDETPASVGDVELGGPAIDISVGLNHVCAILADGHVRCWGQGTRGVLGYGNEETIGDDETPASAGDVPLVCD